MLLMALAFFPSNFRISDRTPKPKIPFFEPSLPNVSFKTPFPPSTEISLNSPVQSLMFSISKFPSRNPTSTFSYIRFLEVDDEELSPWEGAIVYKRDATVAHLEYCTTLERLGMEKLSSKESRSRASDLGLRVTKSVKDFPLGTPVQISVDVTRKKNKLKLDGIVRTVISLGCNRCAELATECIYSNFTLLLTQEPIKEPDMICTENIFSKNKPESSTDGSETGDDEDLVDFDDQLYFPAEEKEIDISKNIRDLIHVEITVTALCDPMCKGLCLKCGVNLNKVTCLCSKQKAQKDTTAANVFEEAQQVFSQGKNPCSM